MKSVLEVGWTDLVLTKICFLASIKRRIPGAAKKRIAQHCPCH